MLHLNWFAFMRLRNMVRLFYYRPFCHRKHDIYVCEMYGVFSSALDPPSTSRTVCASNSDIHALHPHGKNHFQTEIFTGFMLLTVLLLLLLFYFVLFWFIACVFRAESIDVLLRIFFEMVRICAILWHL